MRTTNPILNEKNFQEVGPYYEENAMSIQGTINKSAILLALALISAIWSWSRVSLGTSQAILMIAAIAGFILALITTFKKQWAGITAPIYALCEGVVLGAISIMFEKAYPGIAFQAITLTFAVFASLLIGYKSQLISVTDKFRLGVFAATAGIGLFYLVTFILSFFKINVPIITSSSLFGIGFSVFVVIIASLNLVLDFDFIERAAKSGAPKYMEWFAAFGLLVTLVWLYIEVLRLLAKLRDRR